MSLLTQCPSLGQLEQLLNQQLEEAELLDVAAHIETCERCQQALEVLTRNASHAPLSPVFTADPAATASFMPSSPGEPHIGALDVRSTDIRSVIVPAVPGYQILRELGHGGMGVVYLARQQRPERLVALKMIREGRAIGSETLRRFRQEAETVAQLRHTNIVQVYAVGTAGNLPFFSLELLEGGSLQARLAKNPLPNREAAELLLTLARATHAAHLVGIVHRDLKPANVLFAGDGTLKITDFGLAKRLEDDAEGHTQTGQVIGSPSYMAPEQARGEAKDVGPAADIYALGVILYEMLTGRPPFKGATPVETVQLVVETDPLPPARLQPSISRDLETICLKCLQKEAVQRYESAETLADDVRRYLEGQPIRARRTPLWERGGKWARRHPGKAVFIGGVAAAVLLAAAVWIWRERADLAELSTRRDQTKALIHDGQQALDTDDLDTAQVRISSALTRLDTETRLPELRGWAERLQKQVAEKQSTRQAQAAAAQAGAAEQERYREFIRWKNEALIRDSQLTGLGVSAAIKATETACRNALHLYGAAEFDDRERRPAFRMAGLAATLTAEQKARIEEGCYELLLIFAESIAQRDLTDRPDAERALEILDQAATLRAPTRALHWRRSAYLARLGDATGEKQEKLLAEQKPPVAASDHYLMGREHLRQRKPVEAIAHFTEALRKDSKHFWARFFVAACCFRTQQFQLAHAHLTVCQQQEPDLTWVNLLRGATAAELAAKTKDPREAQSYFQQADADFQAVLAQQPDDDARYTLLVNRSLLRLRQQRFQDARDDAQAAIQLKPKQYNAFVNLAQIQQAQGRWEAARKTLDLAMALDAANAERFVLPMRALDQVQQARGLLGKRRFAEALAAADRALALESDNGNARKIRLECLVQLERYDEVHEACETYLAKNAPDAELLEQRGVARASRKDYLGALADYTQALLMLAAQPAPAPKSTAARRLSELQAARGWMHVILDAPKLALPDFDAAVKTDPENADAYNGRGFALVKLGNHQSAVEDAAEALRCDALVTSAAAKQGLYYNAARIYAQAALAVERSAKVPDLRTHSLRDRYAEQAQELLRTATSLKPAPERAAFWRKIVLVDRELLPLHRRPQFIALAEQYVR